MTAPRHMASPEYVLVCGDDSQHEEGGRFDTTVAARRWMNAHLHCPGHHRIVREGVLILVGG